MRQENIGKVQSETCGIKISSTCYKMGNSQINFETFSFKNLDLDLCCVPGMSMLKHIPEHARACSSKQN